MELVSRLTRRAAATQISRTRCPLTHAISLLLPEPSPVSDALKVFDRHPSRGGCSFRNDLLCNRMVGIRFKSSLLSGDRFQLTPGVQWPIAPTFLLCRFSLKGQALQHTYTVSTIFFTSKPAAMDRASIEGKGEC